MATQGSKGNRKRNSARQKANYAAYRLVNKKRANLIKRLQTRVRRNQAEIKRKAARKPPRVVKEDIGAIKRLKELTHG